MSQLKQIDFAKRMTAQSFEKACFGTEARDADQNGAALLHKFYVQVEDLLGRLDQQQQERIAEAKHHIADAVENRLAHLLSQSAVVMTPQLTFETKLQHTLLPPQLQHTLLPPHPGDRAPHPGPGDFTSSAQELGKTFELGFHRNSAHCDAQDVQHSNRAEHFDEQSMKRNCDESTQTDSNCKSEQMSRIESSADRTGHRSSVDASRSVPLFGSTVTLLSELPQAPQADAPVQFKNELNSNIKTNSAAPQLKAKKTHVGLQMQDTKQFEEDDKLIEFNQVIKPDTDNNSADLNAGKVRPSNFRTSMRFATEIEKKIHDATDAPEVKALASDGANSANESLVVRIVHHRMFEVVMSLFIFANSIMIGIHSDWMVKNSANPGSATGDLDTFDKMEVFFTSVFSAEIILRMIAEGLLFWIGRDWKWNMFDLLVVLAALLEVVISALDVGGITNMRVLRILRTIRIVRSVRIMRFFRELRIMVYGIQSSVQSLIWALILLLLVMFVFSVYITQTVAEELSMQSGKSSENIDRVKELYGTFPDTLLTLFKAISGNGWSELADPLIELSPLMLFVYALFITFVIWALMNVITGVFVDGARKMAELDTDNVIKEQITARKEYMLKIKRVFDQVDINGSGTVSWKQFRTLLANQDVRAYFRSLEIDVVDARAVFDLLDFDDNGRLDAHEFVMGMTQLKGNAKALDVARLRHGNLQVLHRLDKLQEMLQELQRDTV